MAALGIFKEGLNEAKDPFAFDSYISFNQKAWMPSRPNSDSPSFGLHRIHKLHYYVPETLAVTSRIFCHNSDSGFVEKKKRVSNMGQGF